MTARGSVAAWQRTAWHAARGLLLALAVAVRPLTAAAQGDASTVVDRAVAAYGKVSSLRADFTQVVQDAMIGTDETSRGEFLQMRPNRFAMRWRNPPGDVILADGQTLWVYLPSSTPNQVIRSALAHNGQTPDVIAEFLDRPRDRFTIVYVKSEPVLHRPADVLSFTPRAQNTAYRRVLVWVDRQDSLPHQVEITEASGTVRRITFDRMRINGAMSASTFVFRPPSGARVVDASQN
jgi:outer membrane lipoprotein carrier protein